MNQQLINQAFHDWEQFTNSLSDKEKENLMLMSDDIGITSLPYFASNEDYIRFDQTVNRLPKKYLFGEDTIDIVFNVYVKRNLHTTAREFIMEAKAYFISASMSVPDNVKGHILNSESEQYIRDIKQSFGQILTLSADNLTRITPDKINDRRNLGDFILNELIQGLRILMTKVQAVNQIRHENRFSDYITAILRLRLCIWGWSINNQDRTGTSDGGADAGEADILIQAGGEDIALIEALILTSKNKTETQKHMLKCFLYNSNLEHYYMLIYYKGSASNFQNTWTEYSSDILLCPFEPTLALVSGSIMEDLSTSYRNVVNFKIGKTQHITGAVVYHVMVNLGPLV